jgi:CRP-like cAMP-binding protein
MTLDAISRTEILTPEHTRLIVKLEAITRLSDEDRDAIRSLPFRSKSYSENVDLVRQGDRPKECCLLVEGFLCRYKMLGRGQRQIVSFHIPGDMPDLQSLHLHTMDHSLSTLTRARVAFIPHEALNDVIRRRPSIAAALWRDTLVDASIFREWIAGIGRRGAHERIAHVICELYMRLKAVGLAGDNSFELVLTQVEIADALGLSSVHVNRVLQDLRRDGLVASQGRRVTFRDWDELMAAADFDPSYLHLERERPA